MKLGLVLNRIRKFLKQLHANMSKQPPAVVENPATPWARARNKVGSSSRMHIYGQIAIWVLSPIRLQREIDNAIQPAQNNRLILPHGFGRGPFADRTLFTDYRHSFMCDQPI
jgi:hypothetical protein